jgi:hypothetical protein
LRGKEIPRISGLLLVARKKHSGGVWRQSKKDLPIFIFIVSKDERCVIPLPRLREWVVHGAFGIRFGFLQQMYDYVYV